MSTHITKSVAWNSPDTYKYKITLDADFSVTDVQGTTATVRIVGNYIVDQTEHQAEMVAYPASDYGFLFEGNVVPASPTTLIPGTHYMETIPTLFGGDAEQYRNQMLLQFRGDTYQADGGNFTNLWTKTDGLIINRKFGNTSTTVPLDITIQVDVSNGGQSPVLSWATTYVTFNPTEYHWGDSVTWVTFVELTWEAQVNYDANGGSGAPATQSQLVPKSSNSKDFTIPNTTPTWGDYRFLGWSTVQHTGSCTEADVEYEAGDTITVTQASPSVTLYAVWMMDYIPGKSYDNSTWLSHNRTPNGSAKFYHGSWSSSMRTINGGSGTDNPPLIKHPGGWKNQRKVGQE